MLRYLVDPIFQVINTAGKPATGGYIEVYDHVTGDKYYCASDFDGTLHPFKIPLDSLGSNIILADDASTYDIYAYNRYGSLLMSRHNVAVSNSGGGGGEASRKGTIHKIGLWAVEASDPPPKPNEYWVIDLESPNEEEPSGYDRLTVEKAREIHNKGSFFGLRTEHVQNPYEDNLLLETYYDYVSMAQTFIVVLSNTSGYNNEFVEYTLGGFDDYVGVYNNTSKTLLPTDGNGSDVVVTPDGTSTGTAIGASTTLKAFVQKFKNLVGSLKALAFKDKANLTSDVEDVLPIANGGTGASTAPDARTNLDVYSKGEANSAFATAAQGAKADSAIQGVAVNGAVVTPDQDKIVGISVPTASSSTPKMDGTASAGTSVSWAKGDHVHPTDTSREAVANKNNTLVPSSETDYVTAKGIANFVNSSIATNTSTFQGSFTLTQLGLTYPATNVQIAAALNSHTWPSGVTITNNDYVYVEIQNPQTTGVDDRVERFKYSDGLASWGYEFTLNNSSFTAAEVAALESGINATKVGNYDNHLQNTSNPHGVTKSQVGLGNVVNTGDSATPTQNGTDKFTTGGAYTELAKKVDKEPGKGLSENDFTTTYKNKLDGIANGAQVNVIEGVKVNNTELTPDGQKKVNITVPTTAADVSALPASTKYAANISLSVNTSTYVCTVQLKDQDGNNIGNASSIDLPLESVVVSGSYNSTTKKVVLTLQNGSTVEFSVADLVSGLLSENGDGKDVTVTFTQASTRGTAADDFTSGYTLATLFGKVKKWFADLGTAAFKTIVTAWSNPTSDDNIPSEKLVKDSLDNKAVMSVYNETDPKCMRSFIKCNSTGTQFYRKLATAATTNNQESGSVIRLDGCIGAWNSADTTDFRIIVRTRIKALFEAIVFKRVGSRNAFNMVDFELYKESNNTYSLWLKSSAQYTVCTISAFAYLGADIVYDGTNGTPTGTLVAAASGNYKVMMSTDGLQYTPGINLAKQCFVAGSTNTSVSSDASVLTISPWNRDTYFSFVPSKNIPSGSIITISFDVEYSGSDNGNFNVQFGALLYNPANMLERVTADVKGSGHYYIVGKTNVNLVADTAYEWFFDDEQRPIPPQNSVAIKNLKVELGSVPTGFSLAPADVAFSGSYNDLSGTPVLGSINYIAPDRFTHTLTSAEVSSGGFSIIIDASTTFISSAKFNALKSAALYHETIYIDTSVALGHDSVCFNISHTDHDDNGNSSPYVAWPLIMGKRKSNVNAKGILSVPIANYVFKDVLTSIDIYVALPEGVFSAGNVINVEYIAITIR